MASKQMQYSLKVLSGENIGAQITLEPRVPIVVGKSSECNVIFNNEDVADRHIKLVLSEDKVRLRPLAQPVFVDGKDIGLHDVTLRPYQLVTIGKVGFSVGNGGGTWPQASTEGKKVALPLKDNTNKKQKRDTWKKWLFWMGLVLLVAANVHYFNRDNGGLFGAFGLKDSAEQKIYSVIGDSGLSDISVLKGPSGQIKVSGYVSNSDEKQRLMRSIRKVSENIGYEIWVNSNIEDNALLIAQTLGEEKIGFSSKGTGVLLASGYVQSQANWRKLKTNIIDDIEGIETVNDTNIKPVLELLKAGLKEGDLTEAIVLQQKKKTILAEGSPTKVQIRQWHKIRDQITQPVYGHWEIAESFNAPPEIKHFKLSLRSVSVGGVPFIVSKDGKKYLEGAHLGEEYYLKEILADHVLLQHNGTEMPIYFGNKGESK